MDNEKEFRLTIDDTHYRTGVTKKFAARTPYTPKDPKLVHAFIPGVIRTINVKPGSKVKKGDLLLSLEAMKMINQVKSSYEGVVDEIAVEEGDMVRKNQLLLRFK